jgi:phosphoglycerol transferase MdoB-like AlkP superfamily enzyme
MFTRLKIVDEIKKYKYEYIITLIFSILLYMGSEIISRKSIFSTLKASIFHPLYFIMSIIFIFALNITLGTIFFNCRLGNILTMMIILPISILNVIKYDLRGIPLIPSDVFLFNEAQNITNAVNMSKYIVYFILIALAMIITIYKLKEIMYKDFTKKLMVLNLAVSLMIVILVTNSSVAEAGDYSSKGFILNFSSQFNNKRISEGPIHDRIFIEGIIKENKRYFNRFSSNKKNTKNVKPNIIVIMNEAYWDVNLLKNAEIAPNPMKDFEELRKESIYGMMESPVYAGGTANTEFEVLTGLSTHYFENGYMLYPNEVKAPLMSLASVLKNQGYETTAIHPHMGWYYNRNEVYKHLGFDDFLSVEYLVDPEKKGYYISDEAVTDLMIDQIKKSKEPQFIFSVTMQNHGPYDDDRYNEDNMNIEIKGNLDNEGKQILKTYSQGIYDANKALKKLIDYLRNDDQPTMVLFFGDHLPLLGEDLKVYRDSGYYTEDKPYTENYIKTMSTPFILWSNTTEESQNLGLFDSLFLGPYLLDKAGVDMPNYYKYLFHISKEISAINKHFVTDKKGNYFNRTGETKEYEKYNKQIKALQFDIMYGEKMIEEDYSRWVIEDNSSYRKDSNNIRIDTVFKKDDDLIIQGNNLYPTGTLYINNTDIEFEFININKLIVREYKSKIDNSDIKVQYKLIDTNENTLAMTKMFDYVKNEDIFTDNKDK